MVVFLEISMIKVPQKLTTVTRNGRCPQRRSAGKYPITP